MRKIRGEIMNWLRFAQGMPFSGSPGKPMALPNVAVPSDGEHPGIKRIDDNMTEETVDQFHQNYPELEELGNMKAGGDGVVYECKPGVMCKITAIGEEYKIAQRIMELRPSGAVPIIKAYQIQAEQSSVDGKESFTPLWVIQMPKVEMLNYRESFIYGELSAVYSSKFTEGTLNDWAVQEVGKKINKAIGSWNRTVGGPGYENAQSVDMPSIEEIQKMNQLKVDMLQSLKEAGIPTTDIPAMAANVGWYEGRLVAFDFSCGYIG